MWKKWRKETEEKKAEVEKKEKSNQEHWLNKIEETITRLKRENDERKHAKEVNE